MAEIDVNLTVARLVEEMHRAGGPPGDDFWNKLAAQIGMAFKAKKNEVALLRLSANGRFISFLFPIELSKIGTIPLTATHSLATKTIRERHGEIVNNFAAYKHPTVFEAVHLSTEEKPAPIQKIVSAPMIADDKVVGVIQISRKGRAGEPVGADFIPRDLSQLTTLGAVLGKYLATLPPSQSVPSRRAPAAKA